MSEIITCPRNKTACGIYIIKNIVSGRCYIGATTDLHHRLAQHRSSLERGVHQSVLLQRAYDKYGVDAFDYDVLEYCTKFQLLARERYYIKTRFAQYNIVGRVHRKRGPKH